MKAIIFFQFWSLYGILITGMIGLFGAGIYCSTREYNSFIKKFEQFELEY